MKWSWELLDYPKKKKKELRITCLAKKKPWELLVKLPDIRKKFGCNLKLQLHLISFYWIQILINLLLDYISFYTLYIYKISRR